MSSALRNGVLDYPRDDLLENISRNVLGEFGGGMQVYYTARLTLNELWCVGSLLPSRRRWWKWDMPQVMGSCLSNNVYDEMSKKGEDESSTLWEYHG